MPSYKNQSLKTSQNFLTASATVRRIVGLSTLCKSDHAIEIGPGKGHITRELLRKCGTVTAVELDGGIYGKLAEKFAGERSLRLIQGDFLRWALPDTPSKVFANIPFNRTTDIIRKLTGAKNPPDEAWLIVEKGAAKRFTGASGKSLRSLQIKPFFDTEIIYHFKKDDFHPAPSVDTALLHLKRKAAPYIDPAELPAYTRFISSCVENRAGLHRLLTEKQIRTALRLAGLPTDIRLGDILYIQWLCLFRCYIKYGKNK